MSSSRQLAAIMFTDIVGYTALMGEDEEKAFELLRKNRQIQRPLIEIFGGKWIKEIGDGVLASFTTVTDAVYCAKSIQESCLEEDNLKLRIGIHLGEVVFEGDDVFGDGVNIASRLESLAPTGGILVSESVERNIQNKKGIGTIFVREENLKNVKTPVKIYQVKVDGVEVPEPVAGIAERLPTGEPTSSKQRKIVVVSAAIILTLFLAYFFFPGLEKESTLAQPTKSGVQDKTIAVLPFSNTKPDRDTDFLGFAIANQIIGDLDYNKNVIVRPSSSIRKYDQQVFDAIIVADDLKVNYVLTGTYLMQADIIRLDIELIEANSKNMIWRDKIEVDYHNAFELQDIVAKKVVDGLRVQFTQTELSRISKNIPNNPLAYEYYLRGVSYPITKEGGTLAIEMLNQSIKLDSNFAPAYTELGDRYHELALYGIFDSIRFNKAEKLHLKAISINKDLISGLANLSMIYTETARIEQAVEITKQILEINPNYSEAIFSLGYIYRYAGMDKESITKMEKALSIDSGNPSFRSISLSYYNLGEYEKAHHILDIIEPSDWVDGMRSFLYFKQGKNKQAIEIFDKIIEKDPEGFWGLISATYKTIIQGDIAKGLEIMQKREQMNIIDGEPLYYSAADYALLGDKDGCNRFLQKAIDGGYFNYPVMLRDPDLNFMRDDPEFQTILQQAKVKHEAFKEKFFQGSTAVISIR